jgi:hypothetical protein
MGKVSPFFTVGIIDHDGRELGVGEEGEIGIRTDVGGGARWIFKGAWPLLCWTSRSSRGFGA